MSDIITKIKNEVLSEEENLVNFLRKFISIESVTGSEKRAAEFLENEMKKYDFDEVYRDSMGSVIGRIGSGKNIIVYDAHMDTVEPGDPDDWGFDPLEGKLEDGIIFGRGACDDKGPLAAMVYGGKIIKKLSQELDFTLYIVGVVGEEDCEGLAIRNFIEESGIKPDCVVIGEASELRICLGHRGRAQYTITVPGKAGHASRPDEADNSLYKAAKIIEKIEKLQSSLKNHDILGAGTIAATKVETKTNSINTIPGETVIYVDRRLTFGETKEEAQKQLEEIANSYGATVELMIFDDPSYTGLVKEAEEYFPAWLMDEDDKYITAAKDAYQKMFNTEATVGIWHFCTDGVYTRGIAGFPTIGFGPGEGKYVHSEKDQVPVEHLLKAVMFYAYLPFQIIGR